MVAPFTLPEVPPPQCANANRDDIQCGGYNPLLLTPQHYPGIPTKIEHQLSTPPTSPPPQNDENPCQKANLSETYPYPPLTGKCCGQNRDVRQTVKAAVERI